MFPLLYVLISLVVLGSIWRLFSRIWNQGHHRETKVLVIISANSQATLEWWIRSFAFWNWIHGNFCRCICIDLGSTDDTLAILARLQSRYSWMEVKEESEADHSQPVAEFVPAPLRARQPLIIDLRHPENCRIRSLAQELS